MYEITFIIMGVVLGITAARKFYRRQTKSLHDNCVCTESEVNNIRQLSNIYRNEMNRYSQKLKTFTRAKSDVEALLRAK